MKKLIFIFAIAFLNLFLISNLYSVPKNVLIEYVTGTWCGNCPCGHQTLSTISSQYPQTIILAYHAFSNDPWRNFNGNQIVSLMGFSATPTADINRNVFIGTLNYPLWISSIQSQYSNMPDAAVDIQFAAKSYDPNTGQLSFTVSATALQNLTGVYKINAVITENNLIYPQNVYSQCGTPGVINNYVHNHVTRDMFNGATGENFNTGNTWNMNETINKNFITTIDASWTSDNCDVVVFIYKTESTLASSTIQQAVKTSVSGMVGITGNSSIPSVYTLDQNYPNPFNPATNIKFSIPKDGKVSFKVYDIFGKEVADYIDGNLQRGTYNVQFNGLNLASGIYLYVLKTDNFRDTKKMMLVK